MASSLRVNAIVPASGTNVAIGTAGGTITYNANVTGVSTFSSGIVVAAGSTSTPSISPSGDSNTGIFFPSADTVCIGEGGTEVIRVDSSGNVGIATNNPASRLHVNGGLFRVDSNGYGGIILGDNSSNSFHITKETSDNSFGIWSGTIGSGTNRLKIDSSGRVFKPSQVNFMARNHTNGTGGSGSRTIIYGTVEHNIGSGYNSSNGIFTAPVAGYYMFGFGIFTVGTTFRRLAVMNINSTGKVEVTTEANNDTYTNLAFSGIFYLNANDTANVVCTADILTGGIYGNFYGYLLG